MDLKEKTKEIQVVLQKSPQVIDLSQKIDIKNVQGILAFGNKPAIEISKFADKILHSIKSNNIEDSSKMLKRLTSIMSKFNKKDFEEPKQGFFSKLFSKGKNTIDKMLEKYQTVGGEIDHIYVEISQYKNDISKSNEALDEMFDKNIDYYKELEKYIIAGKMALERFKQNEIPQLENRAKNNDQEAVMNLETMKNAYNVLEQRIYDLEMAKMVALQTAPQIRLIQKSNYKLIGKIQSAFVVTIPIFKNALVNQIALKKQKLVADSMAKLDEVTNELLKQNAENIRQQSVEIASIVNSPSISIETMEQTWNTIMQGIEETKKIEEEKKMEREEGRKKIAEFQEKFQKMMNK